MIEEDYPDKWEQTLARDRYHPIAQDRLYASDIQDRLEGDGYDSDNAFRLATKIVNKVKNEYSDSPVVRDREIGVVANQVLEKN